MVITPAEQVHKRYTIKVYNLKYGAELGWRLEYGCLNLPCKVRLLKIFSWKYPFLNKICNKLSVQIRGQRSSCA